MTYIFSNYLKYKAELRGFKLTKIEDILRYSQERYFDTVTHRRIVVGKHDDRIVAIPYDDSNESIMPVTIHTTTRQQIKFRLQTGRYIHE